MACPVIARTCLAVAISIAGTPMPPARTAVSTRWRPLVITSSGSSWASNRTGTPSGSWNTSPALSTAADDVYAGEGRLRLG
jgi:hypothetical protein